MKRARYELPADTEARRRARRRSGLLAPVDHPFLFFALYLPVIASIVGSSLIAPFRLFNVLIPGLWCYGVGGLLCQALATGILQDNLGTATRSGNPVRFALKFSFWAFLYLVIAAYPYVYALLHRSEPPS